MFPALLCGNAVVFKPAEDVPQTGAVFVEVLLDAGLPREAFLELTSVMSRSMATIAASFVDLFGDALLQPGDTERDLGLRYAETLRNLGPLAAPALQQMFNLRLREQMREAVVTQAELQAGHLAGAQPVTVGFVDIVGFTRLGEDVAPDDVGNVIRHFERAVGEAVEPPVRLVKVIGDAVMLVGPEPRDVVGTALTLVERAEEQGEDFPPLRAGLAGGVALNRGGDWYGRPVNLASRVCDVARPASVLATGEVREAAEAYAGPLLPGSDAPGIVAAREGLEAWLRQAVMTSDDPDALWAWVNAPGNREDLVAWKRLLAALEFRDPRRSLCAARVGELRRALT
jgi:adenylate cyclase